MLPGSGPFPSGQSDSGCSQPPSPGLTSTWPPWTAARLSQCLWADAGPGTRAGTSVTYPWSHYVVAAPGGAV